MMHYFVAIRKRQVTTTTTTRCLPEWISRPCEQRNSWTCRPAKFVPKWATGSRDRCNTARWNSPSSAGFPAYSAHASWMKLEPPRVARPTAPFSPWPVCKWRIGSFQTTNKWPMWRHTVDAVARWTQTSNFADLEPLHRFWLHLHPTTFSTNFLFHEAKSRRSRCSPVALHVCSKRPQGGSSVAGCLLFPELFQMTHSHLVILVLTEFYFNLVVYHGNQHILNHFNLISCFVCFEFW